MGKKKLFCNLNVCLILIVLVMGLNMNAGSSKAATVPKSGATYRGLNPSGFLGPVQLINFKQRPSSLDGKKIYFVGAQSHDLAKLVFQAFQKSVPDAIVKYLEIESGHVEQPEVWKEVKEHSDAAVVGVGACGGISPKIAVWTADLERSGIPAAYIVFQEYLDSAKRAGTVSGAPFLRGVPIKPDTDQEKCAGSIVEPLVSALTEPLKKEEKLTGIYTPPKPPRIAITGTMKELETYYHSLDRSDGLPVIIPTEDRVLEMLRGTSHSPDEVVGTMWPEKQQFTVEQVAVNAVMAGCRPNHMPVLLAMAEAYGKEKAFLSETKSSTSFSFMTLVSGPVAKEINMNSGLYAMGPGNRANATIGRALRLFIINLGGGLPGLNMMSKPGNPMMYSWCLAEDNENSPWPPFHTTMGFKAEESCVTVWGGGWVWLESWGVKGLEGLCQQIKLIPEPFGAGIIISPEIAKGFAEQGLASRESVQKYLWENTTQTFKEWSDTSWFRLMKMASARNIYGRKFWPMEYFSYPPETIVKTYARPEHLYIIVATKGEVVAKLQFPHTVSADKWR